MPEIGTSGSPSATSDNVRHKSALSETSDMRPGRVISETS